MREEIFGQCCPSSNYSQSRRGHRRVNRSIARSLCTGSAEASANRNRVLRETHSGGVTVNDCLWHLAQESQPFGGIGASAYHV